MRRRWTRLRSLSAAQWRVVLVSLVLVPAIQLSLRWRGFASTVELLGARSNYAPRTATIEEARPTAEAIAVVTSRPFVGARCLGRSLVLWFLLRRRGIDAELVIGAAPPELTGGLPAHAWVEVAGEPVNDTPGVRDRYGSFDLPQPRLSPGARAVRG